MSALRAGTGLVRLRADGDRKFRFRAGNFLCSCKESYQRNTPRRSPLEPPSLASCPQRSAVTAAPPLSLALTQNRRPRASEERGRAIVNDRPNYAGRAPLCNRLRTVHFYSRLYSGALPSFPRYSGGLSGGLVPLIVFFGYFLSRDRKCRLSPSRPGAKLSIVNCQLSIANIVAADRGLRLYLPRAGIQRQLLDDAGNRRAEGRFRQRRPVADPLAAPYKRDVGR